MPCALSPLDQESTGGCVQRHGRYDVSSARQRPHLTLVEAGAFAGLANLQHLEQSGNAISLVNAGALAELANLERLDLFDNALTLVESWAFAGLANLQTLYIYSLGGNGGLTCLPIGGAAFAALATYRGPRGTRGTRSQSLAWLASTDTASHAEPALQNPPHPLTATPLPIGCARQARS